MTSDWVVTCAMCDKAMPTLAEQYGPHDAPVCWACHVAEFVPVGRRISEEARAKIVEALGRAIDHEAEAEGLREEADQAEGRAEEIRAELSAEHGLSFDVLAEIQDAIDLEDEINWDGIDGAPPGTAANAKRDRERLERWQRMVETV